MAQHYRTRALVFKKVPRGEADYVFSVFCEDFGRLEVVGRAIRKMQSKLRSNIDVLSLSHIEFIQGRNQKTLTDALLIERFSHCKNNLAALTAAGQIAQALDHLLKGQEQDQVLWQLVQEVSTQLNDPSFPETHYGLVYPSFICKALTHAGYALNLYQCVQCHTQLRPPDLVYCPEKGGFLGGDCVRSEESDNTLHPIKPEVITVLRLLARASWPQLMRVKGVERYEYDLAQFTERYFSFHIGQV